MPYQISDPISQKIPLAAARAELRVLEGMLASLTIRNDMEGVRVVRERIKTLLEYNPRAGEYAVPVKLR